MARLGLVGEAMLRAQARLTTKAATIARPLAACPASDGLLSAKPLLTAAELTVAKEVPSPAAPSAKETRERKVMALIGLLRERYPRAFCLPPRPLKIGILADVRVAFPEVSRKVVAHALRYWVSRASYRRALAVGGSRYALDGTECGEVTLEQQQIARAQPRRGSR
jgi:ProQ/FINO family